MAGVLVPDPVLAEHRARGGGRGRLHHGAKNLGERGLLLHLKGRKPLQVGILRLLLRDPAGLKSHQAQLHRLLHVLHVSLRYRLPAHATCPGASPEAALGCLVLGDPLVCASAGAVIAAAKPAKTRRRSMIYLLLRFRRSTKATGLGLAG